MSLARACALILGIEIAASAGVARAEAIDWSMCVASALNNHPAIRAEKESVRSAEAALRSSRATYLPDVDGDLGYSRAHGSSTKDDYTYGVTASQRIYPGLTDMPEVAKSSAELSAARADLDAVMASVRFDLKSAFTEVIHARETLTLAENIAARRRQNVSLVQARFDAGREHKGSHRRAAAQGGQADFELRQARRALRVANRKLLRAMGLDAAPDLSVRDSFSVPLSPPGRDLRAMAEVTPAVRQARSNLEASNADLTLTRREFSPVVTATASTDRNGGSWPPRSTSGDWSGKVSASIPIFKGGQEKHDVIAAEAQIGRLNAGLRNTREQTVLDLEDRHAGLADAIENVDVRQGFLDAAVLRAEIAQAQYTSGLLSFDDWDIIENDLISQQKVALAARRDAVLAEARWELALGKGLEQ